MAKLTEAQKRLLKEASEYGFCNAYGRKWQSIGSLVRRGYLQEITITRYKLTPAGRKALEETR